MPFGMYTEILSRHKGPDVVLGRSVAGQVYQCAGLYTCGRQVLAIEQVLDYLFTFTIQSRPEFLGLNTHDAAFTIDHVGTDRRSVQTVAVSVFEPVPTSAANGALEYERAAVS